MSVVINTLTKGNLTLEISYAEYTDSPREWDNIGILALKHRRYNLSNEIDVNMNEFDYIDELEEYINENYDVVMMLGVSMYDHSGVSLSLCDYKNHVGGWDSSLIGLIFIERNEIFKEYYSDETEEELKNILQNEINLYDKYLNGEVYQYNVYDDKDNILDSCSGYYSEEDILENIDWEYISKESNRINNNIPYNQLELELF